MPTLEMPTLEMPNSGTSVNLPPTTSQGDTPTREKTNGAQTYDVEDSESEPESDKQAPERATKTESPMVAYMEQVFSKRLDAMQSKGVTRSYHVQEFVEQFTSSRDLEKTSDGLYEILQHRAESLQTYIAHFNQGMVAIPECTIHTAISAFKRGLLPIGDLYKELTKYQCKTMEDVLSRAWAHVKWEEDVASCAKAQLKQDPKEAGADQSSEADGPIGQVAVGVENGYDEVNDQIPEEENVETFFDKYFFEIDFSLRKALRRKRESSDKSSKRVATQQPNACSARSLHSNRARAKARSLRSDRASVLLGRYVATELEHSLGRYVVTELERSLSRYVATELFRNIDTTLVHAFSSTLRCYLPKTVANPFHVPRHSNLSIKLYRKNRGKFVLYRKKP
ncbi:hypothetical protein F2Q68_00016408 [Brassica cretica]|uniref:Retrotransposon gag domain-containing protein n=1 Tax=Brassica cretica TaxID=69181 RepID=A0A8S9HL55_BRACR|nr:hypothetical protein F2Q68_00016408 [Brassica cretica]